MCGDRSVDPWCHDTTPVTEWTNWICAVLGLKNLRSFPPFFLGSVVVVEVVDWGKRWPGRISSLLPQAKKKKALVGFHSLSPSCACRGTKTADFPFIVKVKWGGSSIASEGWTRMIFFGGCDDQMSAGRTRVFWSHNLCPPPLAAMQIVKIGSWSLK